MAYRATRFEMGLETSKMALLQQRLLKKDPVGRKEKGYGQDLYPH